MRGSLGRRIVIAVVAVAGGTVAVASLGTWAASRAVLVGAVDRELASWCDRVADMPPPPPPREGPPPEAKTDAGDGRSDPGATPPRTHDGRRRPPWFPGMRGDRGDGRVMFQAAAAADRRIMHASQSVPEGADLASDLAAGFTGRSIRDRILDDGRRVRIATVLAARPTVSGPAEQVLVSLAIDMEPLHGELGRLGWILASLVGVASVLALAAALALRRSLVHPVRALGDSIDRIGPDDLAARLPDDAGPAELRGVVARLNDLLGRLEGAFRREQATIASIAHELRNPVAALRSQIEFRLPAAEEAERAVLEPCLATVMRMQAMVSNLLLLARVESGTERLQPGPVDVTALAVEVAEEWEGRAAGRDITIAVAESPPVVLATSSFHLRCVLDNLIGNAVSHGAAAGRIAVSVEPDADGARCVVVNPVSEPIDLGRIGQPFQRGDVARSASGHCGLGLALSRRLAGLLGGRLDLACQSGEFRAAIAVPAMTPG